MGACDDGAVVGEPPPPPQDDGGDSGSEPPPWCTSEGGWGQATRLDAGDGDNSAPRVFAYGSCQAVSLWSRVSDQDDELPAAQLHDFWHEPDPIGAAKGSPGRIEIDGNAEIAVAVWQENLGGGEYRVFAATYSVDDKYWTAPVRLDGAGGQDPAVSVNSTGAAIAIWGDDMLGGIAARRWDGTIWRSQELVGATPHGGWVGSVGIDEAGQSTAIWTQRTSASGPVVVYANRFSSGSWGAPEMLQFDLTQSAGCCPPDIAVHADGRAVATWAQSASLPQGGWRGDIWAAAFDGSAWGPAERIESDDMVREVSPKVGAGPGGTAVVVWQHGETGSESILSNSYDGTAWGEPGPVEWGSGRAANPRVAVDLDGRALAVWAQRDGNIMNAWANWLDGGWGTPTTLVTEKTGNVSNIRVDFDGDGNPIVVWDQKKGNDRTIWATRHLY